MIRRLTLLLLVVACSLGVASAAAGATTLKLSVPANGALKFDKKVLKAKPGKVTIVMHNGAILPHNIAIKVKGPNVKGKIVPKGGNSTASATLKKGKYTFYCSVPGHEAAGMKGTLVVG